MDLIAALTSKLDLNPGQAQALAGATLGTVKGEVAERFGAETASQFDQQVPELGGWQAQADDALKEDAPEAGGLGGMLGGLMGGGAKGGLGGLMGAAAASGAMGKQAKDMAAVVGVLSKFGLDAGKAAVVGPLLLEFLKKKLDPGMLSKVLAVAPMLAALKGGGAPAATATPEAKGGIGGMLGGLGGLLD
jgi:predicted lipid-binding transport protein (Tim44 family)